VHLPQEGKRFTNVDRQWRKTLDKVQAAPQIITFCDNEELKEQWIKSNAELERVQKNLADYLETKRTAFARFYFLSNDELISILSQTKDPNAVQPHLRKCFEAVHAITMQGSECEMTEMISGEKARAPLHAAEPPSSRTLKPNPQAEPPIRSLPLSLPLSLTLTITWSPRNELLSEQKSSTLSPPTPDARGGGGAASST